MHGFLTDLRQSLRGLRSEPGFAAIAVVALAIGVGSSTAMFSVIDAALVRPLPYLAPERLIQLIAINGAGQRAPMGAVEFFRLEKQAKTVEASGAVHASVDPIASPSGVRTLRTANVSASMFATLGIRPVLGRAFEPAEDLAGPGAVAIASDGFWRRDLGADPHVLGRVLDVDRTPVVVVGVLPQGAVFPRAENAEVLFPLRITAQQAATPAGRNGLFGFARLKPGISTAAAHAEIESIVPPRAAMCDPLTFTVVAATLGIVAFAAGLVPALAAARLDPMTVLRRE
ncbi:MAG: ABC transporter permease [Myxococcales bacterium]